MFSSSIFGCCCSSASKALAELARGTRCQATCHSREPVSRPWKGPFLDVTVLFLVDGCPIWSKQPSRVSHCLWQHVSSALPQHQLTHSRNVQQAEAKSLQQCISPACCAASLQASCSTWPMIRQPAACISTAVFLVGLAAYPGPASVFHKAGLSALQEKRKSVPGPGVGHPGTHHSRRHTGPSAVTLAVLKNVGLSVVITCKCTLKDSAV